MNANEIVRALKEMLPPQVDYAELVCSPVPSSYGVCYVWKNPEPYHISAAIDLIESLQAELAASQRRAQDARNELCQRCGRYKEAHKGACDGCRWKENSDGFEELLERWGNGDSDNAVCATALAALREQAEKSKGCSFCDEESGEHDYMNGLQSIDGTKYLVLETSEWDDYYDCYNDVRIPVKFCPMCGRRLEAESINAGTIGGEIVQWALRELEVREDD